MRNNFTKLGVNKEDCYTIKEVSTLYNLSKVLIRRLIKKKKLSPLFRSKDGFVFLKADVDKKYSLYAGIRKDKNMHYTTREAIKAFKMQETLFDKLCKQGIIVPILTSNHKKLFDKKQIDSVYDIYKNITCSYCGKIFQNKEKRHRKYCSIECMKLYYSEINKRKLIENKKNTCAICGEKIYRTKYRKYCSKECAHSAELKRSIAKNDKIRSIGIKEEVCKNCGNTYIRQHTLQYYCCEQCRKEFKNKSRREKRKKIKFCKHCGKDISYRPKAKFCDYLCAQNYRRKQVSNKKRESLGDRKCLHCGEEINHKEITANFCTKVCWTKYHKKQRTIKIRKLRKLNPCSFCKYSLLNDYSNYCSCGCKEYYKVKEIIEDEELYDILVDYFSSVVRKSISFSFKRREKIKDGFSQEILGTTFEEFQKYIESRFYDNPNTGEKMTFLNYGFYGWHLDHIVPLSTAKSIEDIKRLCHYTNYQPLWYFDNWDKLDKISEKYGNVY